MKIKYNRNKLYEGKTKIIYQTEEEFILVQFFKDHITLDKDIVISGKGVLNNSISAFIMSKLDMINLENHFIEKLNMREQLIQLVDVFPIKVCITYVASGRYVSHFNIEEGYVFDNPMIDFIVKGNNNYPVVNENQLINFGWITKNELNFIKEKALKVSDFLTGMFVGIGIRLVDCSLEFGRVFNEDEFIIMLADEISPDTCRLWDVNSNQKLDFEYAIQNPDKGILVYQEVAKRLKLN